MFGMNRTTRTLVYAVLMVYTAWNLFPLLVMVISGFKSTREIFLNPFALPAKLSFANYAAAWQKANFSLYFTNSVVIALVSIVSLIFLSSMAAYVLARYNFPGRRLVYLFVLLGLVLPARLAIIPIFLLIRSLGLNDTRIGLILIYSATGFSFATFLLVNFFQSIPTDLEDAARIDGAGNFRIYWQVNLPLLRPALATVTVFSFVNIWNDFFFPLILINTNSRKTIPLGVQSFFGEYSIQWDLLFAALNIAVIPIIIFFIILSRQFIEGLTEGAIK